MQTMNERSTPETQKATFEILSSLQSETEKVVHAKTCAKLERERDEARKQLNCTLDELYEEQQSHGKTKGDLTERRIERDVWCLKYSKVVSENKAMREAIKEAHQAIKAVPIEYDPRFFRAGKWSEEALAKLDPFLTDKT